MWNFCWYKKKGGEIQCYRFFSLNYVLAYRCLSFVHLQLCSLQGGFRVVNERKHIFHVYLLSYSFAAMLVSVVIWFSNNLIVFIYAGSSTRYTACSLG